MNWLQFVCFLCVIRGGVSIPHSLNTHVREEMALDKGSYDAQLMCDREGAFSFLQLADEPRVIPIQQKFGVECQCTEQVKIPANMKIPMEVPFGACAATEVKIATKEGGSLQDGLKVDDIRTAIGNPLKVKWAKVQYHHFSDWEGRTSAQVLGLPGGDISEFVNALDAYEEMTGSYVRDSDCKRLLRKYLATTKKISFYMMTDTTAVSQLASSTDIDNLDLRETPDGTEKQKLLDSLVLPEHNGCKFLKGMIAKPEEYDLRQGLAECAVKAFYEILWDKSGNEGKKLRLVELDGINSEKAVVYVKTSAECTSQGVTPLVQPMSSDFKFFVIHQAAADLLRLELAEFLANENERVDAARMKDTMNANGQKYANRAIQNLAPSHPIYEASII